MGIRGKLVASTAVLAFFIGAAPVAYSINEQRNAVYREFETRGILVGRQLGDSLQLLGSHLGSINHASSLQAAQSQRDISSVYVLSPEGTIISDGTTRPVPTGQRHLEFEAARTLVLETREFVTHRDGRMLHISGPVIVDDELQGFVHINMSLTRAESMIRDTIFAQVVIFASLSLLGVGAAFLISYTFSDPIVWMLKGTQAIKNGNFGVRIPVKTHDELGRLAGSINDMAASLRATTVSKNYVNEILQSMVDTLIVVDTDAMILTVNRATQELLGYNERQLVGQAASLVCIDEGYQLTGNRLQHLLGDGTRQDHELSYRTSGGYLIPISFSGSPIRNHSGDVVGYVCIGKDITDRKKAEQERDRLNQKLVETSRQAGMAEIATGVLHNVGNVLNSVNISASMVVDTVRRSKVLGLSRATALLSSHTDDLGEFVTQDEKGRQLPGYLSQLADHLQTEQRSMLDELGSLTRNINHIKDIISTQQSYAKVSGVMEPVALATLIDEAIRVNAATLKDNGVRVIRRVDEVPQVTTDRHQVLQILVNLISNAKDAMDDLKSEKALTIGLRLDDDRPETVRLDVSDNGMGIAEENLTRIFTHGFTTKKRGHGFGLHSAALTAKELDGDLEVSSDGLGTGAKFTLFLPATAREMAA